MLWHQLIFLPKLILLFNYYHDISEQIFLIIFYLKFFKILHQFLFK